MKSRLLTIATIILSFLLIQSGYAQQIFEAIKNKNFEEVRSQIAVDPDLVNMKDENGSTPLHIASGSGNVEIIRYLVQNDADINALNGRRFSPLHIAAAQGNLKTVKILIELGADVNVKNGEDGISVLDIALMSEIQRKKLVVTLLLIEKGAEFDINKSIRFGYSALDLAIAMGSEDVASDLIDLGADIETVRERDGRTPLLNAIIRGRQDIAKMIINKGVDTNLPDDKGNPPIYYAVLKGHTDIVKLLTAKGSELKHTDDQSRNLLHIASLNGYLDIVKILLSENLPVNAKDAHGRSPVYYASKYGHENIADELVKNSTHKEEDLPVNFGKSVYLTKGIAKGEAVAWYLKNRGWAVKTSEHLLIFDNEEFGITRPTQPLLTNGFLTPEEIGDQDIMAIYTCYHGLPGEPAYIHSIEDSVSEIVYIHNALDRWRGRESNFYMNAREEKVVSDVKINTITIMEEMPVLGYLCQLDGVKLFYTGFRPEDFEKFKTEIDYLTGLANDVDMIFFPIPGNGEEDKELLYLVEKLNPKVLLPLDPNRREYLFPERTKFLKGNGHNVKVFSAENPGDHFFYQKLVNE